MGLFFDRLKAIFKKKNIPVMAMIADQKERYERYERADHSEMDEFLDAIDEHIVRGGSMTFKQSKAPATLVAVGFGPDYNTKLAYAKSKSQRRNWNKWKRRG